MLNLPTGSGKTAALDAAVFHLALRFEHPDRAALRIALVVDRRLVVDDAYERAKKIVTCLVDPMQANDPGCLILAEVASRLRQLAQFSEPNSSHQTADNPAPPLVAQRLRGGAPLESEWARTPTQPTILCSTVDQVGSRLLFRGYGITNRMKPVHAGLLGKHTLILLDEAHLSDPFRATVQSVRKLGKAEVRTVLLSATPGVEARRPAQLAREDYDNPELRKRLDACKPANLCIVESDELVDTFAKTAIDIAECLRQRGLAMPVVGVIINRVRLARGVFERLRGSTRYDGFPNDTILLIGRSRGVERGRIADRLKPFRTGNESRKPVVSAQVGSTLEDDGPTPILEWEDDRLPLLRKRPETRTGTGPLFVVATQCLEVGVDLDLDGLVTHAASFDALRQRFGRVNRAGRSIRAEGAILVAKDELKEADDPIYGDRVAKTWKALQQLASEGIVDFGIAALDRRLEASNVDVAELVAPRDRAPVVMPAYFDLWSQTSPPPAADPDVGLFLHGVERRSVGVALAWRGDVTGRDLRRDGVDLTPLLQLVPPQATEMVEVPLWSVRAWLTARRSHADLGEDVPERICNRETDRTGKDGRPAFRWAGAGDPRTGTVFSSELRPGDVLVVPAEYGGCDPFGWNPGSKFPVTDVADEAAQPFRKRRHAIRIARDVVATDDQWDRIGDILADDAVSGSDLVEQLLEVLPSDSDDQECLRPIREPLEALRLARGKIRRLPHLGENDGRLILVAPHGLRQQHVVTGSGAEPSTEDDILSHTSRKAVSINDHTNHVVERVAHSVATLNLPDAVANDLKLAALLHDAGKADCRFQKYLAGGDPWNRPIGPAMAKSGRQSPKGAWRRAGLPSGWRHEALSVQMAQAHPRFAEASDPGLVLWLIGTHHGFGRPFFDFADPDESGDESPAACLGVDYWKVVCGVGPQSMAFDLDGADWAALYRQLKQRYGIWELAHLEAVLRLADHRASEFERSDD